MSGGEGGGGRGVGWVCFFFQAEDGIRDYDVTGVQTCALLIFGYLEDEDGERTEVIIGANEYRLDLDDLLMVVLVNGQTSREAETLAAALQDTERATLIGVATAGDASAYGFVELSDGSAMYMPMSRRYAPSGEILGRIGLTPDVEVISVPESEGYGPESQFNRAYEFLDGQLPPFR
mgnify:CR=1 FL=1